MIPTSNEYQAAVIETNRRSVARILFGIYDVTAKGDATITANSTLGATSINAIKGDIREPEYFPGTFEDDYFRLDGSFYLTPDDVNPTDDIIGWWSASMSDEDGYFGKTLSNTENFVDKVAGSVVENPNKSFSSTFTAIVAPPAYTSANEFVQIRYDQIKYLDGQAVLISSNVQGSIAQQMCSFDLIEAVNRRYGEGTVQGIDLAAKVAWLKANVSKLTCNWWGFGSGGGGNKATLAEWLSDSLIWNPWQSNLTGAISKLSAFETVNAKRLIDANGFVHFLAYAEPALNMPDPTVAPVLTASGSGSALAAGTYYARYAWNAGNGTITAASPSANITITAGQNIVVTMPASRPAGSINNVIYLSTSGAEKYQNVSNVPTYTQSAALNAGSSAPTVSTAVVPSIINTDYVELIVEVIPSPVVPSINVQFAGNHSSLGIGLFFGSAEYCRDLTIAWYNGATVLDTVDIIDNTEQDLNIPRIINNYNKIVVTFTRTAKPHRYVRLMELGFGLEELFDSEQLVSARIVEETNPSNSTLSVNSLKFTVLNENQRFNMLNPQGIFAYLQRRQKIIAKSGLWTGDRYEYVSLGNFYLSDWKNSTGITATLEATDTIGLLDKTTYRASKFWINEPVTNVLKHILADAGQFSLVVTLAAAAEVVNGYIPVKSHREALADVLMATRNTLRVERSGILSCFKPSYDSGVASIDYTTLLGSPVIEQKALITSVEVREFAYALSASTTEINKSTFSVIGTQTVVIDFGKAVSAPSVVVTGSGSIVGSPLYSAVSVSLVILGTGNVTVTVSGKEYIEAARTVSASIAVPAGELPQVATVGDNTLVVGNGSQIAANQLAYLQRRILMKFDYWDNPAIQSGDCVEVETMFNVNYQGIVERQEITFAPKLIARLEVTG